MADTSKLLGAERMRRTFRRLRSSSVLMRPVAAMLFQEGERIMAQSKKQVPVDTGNLKNTGIVEPPEIQGLEASVLLGYGGPAVDYAVTVHENLQAKHKVGNALYLERPFNDNLPGAQRRLGVRLRGSLRDSLRGTSRTL